MTLADAIQRAHSGEQAGMLFLYQQTAASIWMTAFILGCPEIGTKAISVFHKMEACIATLHSPSDLRVWMGRIVYAELLPAAAHTSRPVKNLNGELKRVYSAISSLSPEERTALLILCADGCSAPQASEILGVPDIEIKRAMRRARQKIAEQMKAFDDCVTYNTTWLIEQLSMLRESIQTAYSEQLDTVFACLQSGEQYHEDTFEVVEEMTEEVSQQAPQQVPQENEEKSGFFHKLFRSKRFG